MGLGIAISVNGSPDTQLASLAARVEVTQRLDETAQYTVVFSEDVCDNDFQLLRESKLDPGSVLSFLVPVDNRMECLIKGPVHSQQIHLVHGGAGSRLEVRGSDTSLLMDRALKSKVWSNVRDSEVVQAIIGNYGWTADVKTTAGQHVEERHELVQRMNDLQFIRRLARRNGCHFWLTFDANGRETAHFKQFDLTMPPVADLILNEKDNNITSFQLSWDVERPTSVEGAQQNLNTNESMDGNVAQSPQSSLGNKSLSQISPVTRSTHVSAPADDTGNIQARSEATLMEAEFFIRASCSVSFQRLCKVLNAHSLVNLRGAGSRHSGIYLITSVRHVIDGTDHKMDVELLRNGWNQT